MYEPPSSVVLSHIFSRDTSVEEKRDPPQGRQKEKMSDTEKPEEIEENGIALRLITHLSIVTLNGQTVYTNLQLFHHQWIRASDVTTCFAHFSRMGYPNV